MDEPPPFPSAIDLLERRNRAIGSLLTAERAAAYLAILLILLRFRNNHELEPLHDDVQAALGDAADAAAFNQDIRQLLDWELVTQRIEKERLRGYRDVRRRKFRYRIADDAVSFLLWLESRRQDDLHPEDADTRDLLADLVASLRETARLINKLSPAAIDYEEARAIFHRLARMSAATESVTKSLGDFNIRLLAFAAGSYDIPRARQLIGELDRFLERFLRRIHTLRGEIRPEIDKLRQPRIAARWDACARIMRDEAAATRSLLRARIPEPLPTLAALAAFYGPSGQLEQLTSRVNRSALLVWQKLHAHLRELERRSHRLEDVRLRVRELAALPSAAVPRAWMRAVFQPAHMIGDLHEWTGHLKATPPQPVWSKHRVRGETHVWMEPRAPEGERPVVSIEERRLERLADWMRRHGVAPDGGQAARLSSASIGAFDDFARLLEIMRSGLLGNGRRLARIGLAAEPLDDTAVVATDDASLEFPDLAIHPADIS
ncbi:MAG: hypothetical protein RBS99_13740 [Rhodospirillales bacterium]|jgi:hypothetical protein|nr:hypothetical protein [Rhodospirillales bacterium]